MHSDGTKEFFADIPIPYKRLIIVGFDMNNVMDSKHPFQHNFFPNNRHT